MYFLRERGFVDFASGIWLVTEQGNDFIKDNSILKILEDEEFEFIIDAITNEALEKEWDYQAIRSYAEQNLSSERQCKKIIEIDDEISIN